MLSFQVNLTTQPSNVKTIASLPSTWQFEQGAQDESSVEDIEAAQILANLHAAPPNKVLWIYLF
jgi:hypothetical protein